MLLITSFYFSRTRCDVMQIKPPTFDSIAISAVIIRHRIKYRTNDTSLCLTYKANAYPTLHFVHKLWILNANVNTLYSDVNTSGAESSSIQTDTRVGNGNIQWRTVSAVFVIPRTTWQELMNTHTHAYTRAGKRKSRGGERSGGSRVKSWRHGWVIGVLGFHGHAASRPGREADGMVLSKRTAWFTTL